MSYRLVIDGNSVYEIDEDFERYRENRMGGGNGKRSRKPEEKAQKRVDGKTKENRIPGERTEKGGQDQRPPAFWILRISSRRSRRRFPSRRSSREAG